MKALRENIPVIALAILALVGCGGGHGPDPGGPGDPPSGEIRVEFPAPRTFMEMGAAESITVRGRFDGDVTPKTILVNGVDAEIDATGDRWSTSIPLLAGATTSVEVEAFGEGGEQLDRQTLAIEEVSILPYYLSALAVSEGGEVFAVDVAHQRILAFNENKQAFLATMPQFGASSLRRVLGWDAETQRLLAVNQHALLAASPTGATYDILSSTNAHFATGEGPPITFPADMEVHSAARVAYLALPQQNAVAAVDLVTGNREYIAHNDDGGASPFYPVSLALDEASNQLYALAGQQLYRVDLAGVPREKLDVNLQPVVKAMQVAFDPVHGSLLIAGRLMDDNASDAVYRLDLDTLEMTLVSGPERGAGPALETINDLKVDPRNGAILIADHGAETIVKVDPDSGDRFANELHFGAAEMGERWRTPVDVLQNGSNLLVADAPGGRLLTVPLSDSASTELSGSAAGSGPEFGRIRRAKIPHGTDELYVLTQDGRLFQVDPETGDRVLLHDVADWADELDGFKPRSFDVDPATGVVYLLGNSNGHVQLLSLAAPAAQPEIIVDTAWDEDVAIMLSDAIDLQIDPLRDRIIVGGIHGNGPLVSVSPTADAAEVIEIGSGILANRLQLSADGHYLYVLSTAGIVRFNLETYSTDELTHASKDGEGPLGAHQYDGSFHYDETENVVWFGLTQNGTILMYDVESGDRVYVAR